MTEEFLGCQCSTTLDSGNRHILWHLSGFRTVGWASVCLRLDANYGYPEESGIGDARFTPVNPDLTLYSTLMRPIFSEVQVGISYNLLQNSCTVLTIRSIYSAKNLPQVTILNQIVTCGTQYICSAHSSQAECFSYCLRLSSTILSHSSHLSFSDCTGVSSSSS